jgi:cation diffusion facilitator family transporter
MIYYHIKNMTIFAQRTKILQISLYAILSAFLVEFVIGLYSNSLGLITDSIHALLDSVVTVILILAARMATKPPDKEHTYGHGKVEPLGGMLGGIIILLIAAFFIYESIQRLQDPNPQILPSLIGLVAGIYTIGIDIFRISILRKSIKKIGGTTLRADFYHALMDFGSTMVAILGIVLVSYGFHNADFAAALILGVVLAILSLKLIHKSALELTDTISPDMVSKVKSIVQGTKGVIDVGPILMRRSGDVIFADVTISLKGDISFDKAHHTSTQVENNIQSAIPNCMVTIHFEPSWDKSTPSNSKIIDIATDVDGVKEIHNVNSYTYEEKTYVNLHAMVDKNKSLEEAHKISDQIEHKIKQNISGIEHVTVHLEPYVTIPKNLQIKDETIKEKLYTILGEYPEIRKVGRVVDLYFKDVIKIEIDCSFDKDLSIEKVHDLTSHIEHRIHSRFKNSIVTIHTEPI